MKNVSLVQMKKNQKGRVVEILSGSSLAFPCIATFIVLFKELGLRDLIKATFIMIATGSIVGTILNIGITG